MSKEPSSAQALVGKACFSRSSVPDAGPIANANAAVMQGRTDEDTERGGARQICEKRKERNDRVLGLRDFGTDIANVCLVLICSAAYRKTQKRYADFGEGVAEIYCFRHTCMKGCEALQICQRQLE